MQKALLRRLRDYETLGETYPVQKTGRPALGVDTQTLVESAYWVGRAAQFRLTTRAQEKAVQRALHGLGII